eukprot:307665-Rhodomonas_salina.1
MRLCACYAMPGTESAQRANRLRERGIKQSITLVDGHRGMVEQREGRTLRDPREGGRRAVYGHVYAESPRVGFFPLSSYAYAMRCHVPTTCMGLRCKLRACYAMSGTVLCDGRRGYAMSGTEIAYAGSRASRMCVRLSLGPYPDLPTHLLRDARPDVLSVVEHEEEEEGKEEEGKEEEGGGRGEMTEDGGGYTAMECFVTSEYSVIPVETGW